MAALGMRPATSEAMTVEIHEVLSAHREIVSQNERYKALIDKLTEKFKTLEREQVDYKGALDSIRAGAAGPAAHSLLDPRFVDKPGKSCGKADEWKDWSEVLMSFAEIADPKLGEAMDKYGNSKETVLMANMDAEERRAARQLHYSLVMLCRATGWPMLRYQRGGTEAGGWGLRKDARPVKEKVEFTTQGTERGLNVC